MPFACPYPLSLSRGGSGMAQTRFIARPPMNEVILGDFLISA